MVRLLKNGKPIVFLRSSSRNNQSHCLQCKCLFDERKFRRMLDPCGHVKCLCCIQKVKEVCVQCLNFSKSSRDSESISSDCSFPGSLTSGSTSSGITLRKLVVDDVKLTEGTQSGLQCAKTGRKAKTKTLRRCDQSSRKPDLDVCGSKHFGLACYKCGQRFISPLLLKAHISVHNNSESKATVRVKKEPKPIRRLHSICHGVARNRRSSLPLFVCNICNKRFQLRASLGIHMRLHTGNNLHFCNICGRGFTSRSHLNRHLQSHLKNNVKWKNCPLRCPQCGKGFQNSCSLKRHTSIACKILEYSDLGQL